MRTKYGDPSDEEHRTAGSITDEGISPIAPCLRATSGHTSRERSVC